MNILELKNIITNIKYKLQGLNSRMEMMKPRISDTRDRSRAIIQFEQQSENRFKKNKLA